MGQREPRCLAAQRRPQTLIDVRADWGVNSPGRRHSGHSPRSMQPPKAFLSIYIACHCQNRRWVAVLSAAVKDEVRAFSGGARARTPEGPGMGDILVATAARPQGAHFDEKLEDRQPHAAWCQCQLVRRCLFNPTKFTAKGI